MSFFDAALSPLKKYATFSGRATRQEFWSFYLLVWVAVIVMAAVGLGAIAGVAILAVVVPLVAVSVRRLHDTNHAGIWFLVSAIPLGSFYLLYLLAKGSDLGLNKFDGALYAPVAPGSVPLPAPVV
jgi:uncharacterized membrane protein YhaH (DUF805 family)